MGLVTVLGFFTYGIVLVAAADELSAPSWWIWRDPLLGVIAIVALLWRRRFPVLIAMLTAGCTIYSLAAAPAAGLALASLATRRRWRELVLLLPLWLAAALTAGWLVPNDTEASLATALITQAAAYAAFTGSARRSGHDGTPSPRCGSGRRPPSASRVSGSPAPRPTSGPGSRARCTTCWPIGSH